MSKEKEIKVSNEIIVNDIHEIRPTELPLVVELPEGASEAQIEFAKIINAYAYQNRAKWLVKKDALIKKLEALKDAPAPQESNLKVNKSNF